MNKRRDHSSLLVLILMSAAMLILAGGCGSAPTDPLTEISNSLRGLPDYSVVLQDMKEEGNFFKSYYHQYKIITPEKSTETGWLQVSEDFFQKNMPFLGMTIYVKKDGQETAQQEPPGYSYVGDSRYGRWSTDSSGRSFWEFYGQYAFLSHMLGGGPIYRTYYDSYHTTVRSGRPYFGNDKQYGTAGTYTQKTRPDFYSRRMSSASQSKSSFAGKVESRTGRTSVGTRSRSGSVGK